MGGVEPAGQGGVDGVDGQADGDRLAVPQLKPAHHLQLVRRPVPEIQRPRLPLFERVPPLGNVPQVPEGRAADDGQGLVPLPAADGRRIPPQVVQQLGILQQGHLHRLGKSAHKIPLAKAVQQARVVDHPPGGGEGSHPVFLAKQVDAVFDSHAGIGLSQGGGGQADQANAAVGDGGGKADRVQHRSAPNHNHVTAAVQVRGAKDLQHPLQHMNVVLDRLAARDPLDVAHPRHAVGVFVAETADLAQQPRTSSAEVVIQPELDPGPPVAGGGQQVGQHILVRGEHVAGKPQPVQLRDLKGDVQGVGFAKIAHGAPGRALRGGCPTRPRRPSFL